MLILLSRTVLNDLQLQRPSTTSSFIASYFFRYTRSDYSSIQPSTQVTTCAGVTTSWPTHVQLEVVPSEWLFRASRPIPYVDDRSTVIKSFWLDGFRSTIRVFPVDTQMGLQYIGNGEDGIDFTMARLVDRALYVRASLGCIVGHCPEACTQALIREIVSFRALQ